MFKIPLVRGRMFTDRDDGGSAPVVLINEGLAKQFWLNSDPVGQRITIGKGVGGEFEEPPREIIGIVGDVRDQGLDNNPDPIMYVPVAQVTDGVTALNNGIIPITWTIRTSVEPFSLSKEIQEQLRRASGGLPVAHVRSMEQVRGESTARTDFNMTLLVIFAGVALLLAAIGIYGLMSYSVQQRTREIGVRMALGASPREVRKMVVRQGMVLALTGMFIGIVAALGLTRLMASLLYGVAPRDPVAMTSVALLLVGVALAARTFRRGELRGWIRLYRYGTNRIWRACYFYLPSLSRRKAFSVTTGQTADSSYRVHRREAPRIHRHSIEYAPAECGTNPLSMIFPFTICFSGVMKSIIFPSYRDSSNCCVIASFR